MKKEELIKKIQALREQLDELIFMMAILPEPEFKPVPEPQPLSEDGYMSPREVQKFLSIKKSTFYDWLNKGLLPPAIFFGPKSPRWKKSEIEGKYRNERDKKRNDNPRDKVGRN